MPETKVTGLTALNVSALREIATGSITYRDFTGYVKGEPTYRDTVIEIVVADVIRDVVLTATTATFPATPEVAQHFLLLVIAQITRQGHPKASLHAVVRKLAG